MKKFIKSFIVAAMVIVLAMTSAVTAFAAGPDGVKVQFDGKNIAFTDAEPQMVDGITMVPFRAMFEALGANVSYDAEAETITAVKGDKEISLKIGGSDASITENGVKTDKKMDAASYIDETTGRIYVPIRFAAESMNYAIGWDAAENTAVMIDPATVFSGADQDFSILCKLMRTNIDLDKTYETTGQFNMAVDAPDTGFIFPGMGFTASGKIDGVHRYGSEPCF
jgi:hypothetical protein